jgi:hypothetical protein
VTGTRKVILRIATALVIAGLAVLAVTMWWASSLYQSDQVDSAHADAAFAEVRARFPGVDPAFHIRERRLVIGRQPPIATSSTSAAAVHMLVWQPRERMLTRVTLPLWTSKIATEPLPLEATAASRWRHTRREAGRDVESIGVSRTALLANRTTSLSAQ